jgi:putative membrane protein
MMFFIGLLVGVIPLIYSRAKHSDSDSNADSDRESEFVRKFKFFKQREIIIIIMPLLVMIIIANVKPDAAVNPAEVISGMGVPYMFFVFFSGIITAAALVIPGLSGAFILLLMGAYHVVIYSISSAGNFLADITNISLLLDICKVLLPFGIGAIIGVLAMARLIEKLLKDYTQTVYLIILGLMLGSVYALCKDPIVFQSGMSVITAVIGSFTFLSGCALAFFMGKKRG